jgi:uncharacterized protein YukE
VSKADKKVFEWLMREMVRAEKKAQEALDSLGVAIAQIEDELAHLDDRPE